MDRDDAEQVLDYLLEAAYELDEAKAAVSLLADRDEEAASLREFIIKLNSELLRTIFDRFPDLVPFEHFPEINSSLQWDQVHLPPSVSEAQVDRIIFSFVKPQWRKMALIVYQATEEGQKLAPGLTDEIFAARIQVLVAAERLESQGDDLRKWRHSEVRLKPAALRLAKSDS